MDYMTVKEAAEQWGYSEGTVRNWCKDDKIQLILKPQKISGRWRIPKGAPCPKKVKHAVVKNKG